jgi:plasmid stabilization system protein ParE
MIQYAFHPEARADLEEIWEFIRADNPDAADLVIAEILSVIRALVPSPIKVTNARTSRHGLCASFWYMNI